MEGETVYGIENGLKLCKDRLNRDKRISRDIKYAILDFVDDLAIMNVSDHVQYSYIERLEIVARMMGPRFLEPNRRIVKETMLSLKRSKSRRNDYYSDSTLNSIYNANVNASFSISQEEMDWSIQHIHVCVEGQH